MIETNLLCFLAKWRGELRRFLSPLAPGTRHRDIADRLTLGTGRWFLERPEFESWIRSGEEGDSRVLCCVGNPGAGKTGLAYVIQLNEFEKRTDSNLN